MRTMAKTTAGIMALLLWGLVAFIGTSTSTAVDTTAQDLGHQTGNLRTGVGHVEVQGRQLQAEETCANGLPGFEASSVCCPLSCGRCGGEGCSQLGEGCCTSDVKDSGDLCSETMAAPCIIDDDDVEEPMCIAGVPGILVSDVCCSSSCGSCGGVGCSGRDGGDNFTGSEACCGGGVRTLGRVCSEEVGAPCVVEEDIPAPTPAPVMEEDQTCANGLPGFEASSVCCPLSCGRCGGEGCSQLGEGCCTSDVKDSGDLCSETMAAPCIIDDDVVEEPMCIAGVPGILVSDVCCSSSCGSCGGVGCSGRDGGDNFTGSEACCGGGVRALGRVCSEEVGAPCVVEEDMPAPTPAPVMEEGSMCIDGVPGIVDKNACCPLSCGECGGVGCSGRDGGDNFTGSEACCGGGVLTLGRVCSEEVGAPCVIEEDMPAPTPAPTPAPVMEEDPMCIDGVPGLLDRDACCPLICGECGGDDCRDRDGGEGFTGREACCRGGVRSLERVCSEEVGAPCVVGDD